MKVLITGASGYVGARLSHFLQQKQFIVTGVARQPSQIPAAMRPCFSDLIRADLSVNEDYANIENLKVDCVVHTVSLDRTQSELDLRQALLTNTFPALKLLRWASRAGASTFIYLSTQQVYGSNGVNRITEETAPCPGNSYALTHLLSEEIVLREAAILGIRPVIVRLSNSYGMPAYDRETFWTPALNDICRMATTTGVIRLRGTGREQRDFIDLEDVAHATLHFLRSTNARGIYNLGTGATTSLAKVATQVAEETYRLTGDKVEIVTPAGPLGKISDTPPEFQFGIGKLKSTGFTPTVELKTGIHRLLSGLQQIRQQKAS